MDATSPTLSKETSIIDTTKAETDDETLPLPKEGELETQQEEPIISLHALVGISTPQTLQLSRMY